MSIIRVGLAETKDFADGYDAIFGNKKKPAETAEAGAEEGGEAKKARKKPTRAKAVKKTTAKKAKKKPAKKTTES